METAVISYRVADFLKKHPPFHAMDDADLLGLAARGRVRFHEPNEYILWQGEPHRLQVFVIQQGTVSLWDEAGERVELRDVRGVGDMLGIERYCDAPALPVLRALGKRCRDLRVSGGRLRRVRAEVPARGAVRRGRGPGHARLSAGDRATQPAGDLPARGGGAQSRSRPVAATTASRTSLSAFSTRSSQAMAVVDDGGRARGVLTAETRALLGRRWRRQRTAAGDRDAAGGAPTVVAPDASVTDGVIAMGGADVPALAITADGTPDGRLQAIVTPADLALFFGEQPATLLRDIRLASHLQRVARAQSARARPDARVPDRRGGCRMAGAAHASHRCRDREAHPRVDRRGASARHAGASAGSSGRGESLTKLAPHLLVLLADDDDEAAARDTYQRVLDALEECDYLPRDLAFDTAFYVASAREWTGRYRGWIRDPVMQEMSRARTLFDLRPVHGRRSLWQQVDASLTEQVDRDFLHVAGQRLPDQPPASHVLPGCRR